MSRFNPGAILYDLAENALASVQDGAVWALSVIAKTAVDEDGNYQYIKSTDGGGVAVVLVDEDGNAVKVRRLGANTIMVEDDVIHGQLERISEQLEELTDLLKAVGA